MRLFYARHNRLAVSSSRERVVTHASIESSGMRFLSRIAWAAAAASLLSPLSSAPAMSMCTLWK
jgi:hypothetical protein